MITMNEYILFKPKRKNKAQKKNSCILLNCILASSELYSVSTEEEEGTEGEE